VGGGNTVLVSYVYHYPLYVLSLFSLSVLSCFFLLYDSRILMAERSGMRCLLIYRSMSTTNAFITVIRFIISWSCCPDAFRSHIVTHCSTWIQTMRLKTKQFVFLRIGRIVLRRNSMVRIEFVGLTGLT